ncbi:MAG: alpha/beta fold hydrolase [Gammaproteobacteria bacterium]|nr:alpha/beta fold hydrolase [Gammaproteobacteria bacterium]
MKRLLSKVLLLISLLLPGFVAADIAVLIHGYHSSGKPWRHIGIVHALVSNGWNDAGDYVPVLGNIGIPGHTLSGTGKHVVTVELPSESPVEVQADLLNLYLAAMSTLFPQQKIHLIAHSAGGIVARLALVRNTLYSEKPLPVVQLITIATPHLGSPMAEIAEMAADSPLSFFAPLFGVNEINRAEILYSQLGREKENYFLYWLNRQPHPAIAYTSIVRADDSLFSGDVLVPSANQNMAYVPAIGPAQNQLLLTPGNHKLKYADGLLLRRLLP